MGTHYCHLKLDERRKLAKWLEAKMPISEIADRLGRDPSTIYRDRRIVDEHFAEEAPHLLAARITGGNMDAQARGTARSRLEALQALRAIAAIMVVAFHANVHTLPNKMQVDPAWSGLNMGYAGVEIFFVLSGFIMYYVHGSELGRPSRLAPYLRKRVVRIMPFFLVVLVGVVALRVLDGEPVPPVADLLASAALLPLPERHLLGVQWTLSFEMFFYLIFASAVWNARFGMAIGTLWFSACAAAALSDWDGPGSYFLLSSYNLLFLMGIIVARILASTRGIGRVPAGAAVIGGVALFMGVGLAEAVWGVGFGKDLRTVAYGVAVAGLIFGLVRLERSGAITTPHWATFLGNASFAIYLVHVTVMAVAAKLLMTIGLSTIDSGVLVVILVAMGTAGGVAAHVAIERPLLAAFRTRPQIPPGLQSTYAGSDPIDRPRRL